MIKALEQQKRLKIYSSNTIHLIPEYNLLSNELKEGIDVVSRVLPFRVNNYVCEQLIDWNNIPNDPMFRLTFLQKEMLKTTQFQQINEAIKSSDKQKEKELIQKFRLEMNPHPAGQKTSNVPLWNKQPVPGLQHKYKETALIFPSQGQQCHSYCTFCFRWPQFIGKNDLRFATDQAHTFVNYIQSHPEITDVLITGGDPMIMNIKKLRAYIEPLLEIDHVTNIRIGSKSISYWPYRFVTDKDSLEVLNLFEQVVESGRNLAFMAHINHPKEIETDIAQQAIRNIQQTGAIIRSQSPILRGINDSADIWAKMWRLQVQLGIIPYYMFKERDTGPKDFFGITLEEAYEIFTTAYKQVSGLSRTVRGPSMSATPGKVVLQGIQEINGQKVFILSMIQSRNPDIVNKPFFAKYNPNAYWLDDLEPAFADSFPF